MGQTAAKQTQTQPAVVEEQQQKHIGQTTSNDHNKSKTDSSLDFQFILAKLRERYKTLQGASSFTHHTTDWDGSGWLNLPVELQSIVFNFLDPFDLIVAASVCKYWKELAYTDALWKGFCNATEEEKETSGITWRELYGLELLIDFSWSQIHRGRSIQVSNQGKTAYCPGGWGSVGMDIVLLEGRWSWDIRLERCPYNNYFIGVVRSSTGEDEYQSITSTDWMFYPRTPSGQRVGYGEDCFEGDIVGVILDLEKKTIGFSKNGHYLGVLNSNVSAPVRPCISLASSQATITSFKFDGCSNPKSATRCCVSPKKNK